MRHSVDGMARLRFRALLWAVVLVLVAGLLRPGMAGAADPLGLGAATSEVHAALQDMADALKGAPPEVQTTTSADLHLMGEAITRALDRLDAASIADPTLVYDLDFLADIAHAATDELHAISARPRADLDPDRAARIDRLTAAAADRLTEVNLVLDGWSERHRNAVVELEDDGGVLVVRATDRRIYNGIRYVSIGLLAVGLLAVGLQLLRVSEERVDARARPRRSPLLSGLAGGALAMFFAGCAVFSLRPGMLAALSAEVRVETQQHPCERLAAQRERLMAAQETDHPGLVEATKQRMRPAAQDCLGLPSDVVTAEAIERLAARTALAHGEPAPVRRQGIGLATADPGVTNLRVASPPEVAELEPAETQVSDDLGTLLASLRKSEAAAASDPAGTGEPAPQPVAPAPQSVEPAARPVEPAPQSVEPAARPVAPAPQPVAPAAGPDQTVALDEPAPAPPSEPPERKPELFVTTTALNYREGPSIDARRLGTLDPGARLTVVGQDDGGWAAVRLSDGRQAYVATEYLEPAP